MEAHGRFDVEMHNLEALYAATLYAYDEAVEHTKERVRERYLDPEKPIEKQLSGDYKYTIASNVATLKKKYKNDFRKQLRETLFIRAISIFEVFLVDTVFEIFLARKDLFHIKKEESLSYERLLSFKSLSEISTHLINKECRSLHSIGFDKIKLYFSKHFKINFGNCVIPMSSIKKYHDTRHLLVHRLGRTDLKYRKRYNSSDRKVKVEKSDLIQAFEDIRCFSDYIHSEAVLLNKKLPRRVSRNTEIAVKGMVIASPLSRQGKDALLENHSFACDDNILTVSDILQGTKKNDDSSITLTLMGNSRHLQAYIEHLRTLEREEHLDVEDFTISNPKRKKNEKPIPKGTTKKIIEALPPMPWPVSIHREIAIQFDITNRQAYSLLRKLKQEDSGATTSTES